MRELRQNASEYLKRVAAGERVEITSRGRPVAMLVPVPEDQWDVLIAAGRIHPAATGSGTAHDVVGRPPRDHGVDASDELRAGREERF